MAATIKAAANTNVTIRMMVEGRMIYSPHPVLACLHKAYELQSSSIVGRILEHRPELRARYDAWMDAAEELNAWIGGLTMWEASGRLRKPEDFKG